MSTAIPHAPHKLITAILPAEVDVLHVLRRLKNEVGIVASNLSYARGMGRITRERGDVSDQAQREILSVVVEPERAEELFAWLFEAADMNRPHGGILYMQPLRVATEYRLPDLPEEEGEGDI